MPKRIIAAGIIIGAATLGGFTIWKSNIPLAPQTLIEAMGRETDRRATLERPANESIDSLPAPAATEPLKPLTEKELARNATNDLAAKIARELVARNPNGPSLLDGRSKISAVDPQKLADEITAETESQFDYNTFKPKITLDSLRLVPASTGTAAADYLNAVQVILKKNFSSLNINMNTFLPTDALRLGDAARRSGEELLALAVPANLAPWHAEEISLLRAQEKVFTALGEASRDPIASLTALRAFPLVNQELATLKDKFNGFIAFNKIAL